MRNSRNTLQTLYHSKIFTSEKNFQYLERSFENVTNDSERNLNHEVRNILYFLLRTSVDYLIGRHTIQKNDEMVKDLDMFVKTLEFTKILCLGMQHMQSNEDGWKNYK